MGGGGGGYIQFKRKKLTQTCRVHFHLHRPMVNDWPNIMKGVFYNDDYTSLPDSKHLGSNVLQCTSLCKMISMVMQE